MSWSVGCETDGCEVTITRLDRECCNCETETELFTSFAQKPLSTAFKRGVEHQLVEFVMSHRLNMHTYKIAIRRLSGCIFVNEDFWLSWSYQSCTISSTHTRDVTHSFIRWNLLASGLGRNGDKY